VQTSTPKYNKAEIYYSLIPHYWKKGFALEAVKALLNYGFKTLKLHRIEAGVATENVNSLRLLEKTGMKREGMHRKILPVGGKWIDNYSYAILEDDFLKENF
jgi:RimJ/RimL family protein N-acetyltransferase